MNRVRNRVLVVDNDEDVLVQVENALESEGYQTTTAWSGQQALYLLAEQAFDLVVLDDQLSDFSAEDLLRQMPRSRAIPVIVTQNPGAAPCTADRYLALGASAVVLKRPPGEIQSAVGQFLAAACL